MSRSDRLLRLLQVLRTLPSPATAEQLARETQVSIRSIYRDIESLRAGGAEIAGERGYGYTLVEDGALPPQTFSRIELEALVLGLAEVRHMGDPALARAASSVIAKVAGILPSLGQQHLLHAVSQVRRLEKRYVPLPDMDVVRESCWRELALNIQYKDQNGKKSERQIWPLAIVYLDRMLVVLAWCCVRKDFRKYLASRILNAELTGESFRPRRSAMLREYLKILAKEKTNE